MERFPNNNDLHTFITGVNREMATEYERIRRRTLEDPGTAGDQGEENWATLLREWLPPYLQIVTKGRILNAQERPARKSTCWCCRQHIPSGC